MADLDLLSAQHRSKRRELLTLEGELYRALQQHYDVQPGDVIVYERGRTDHRLLVSHLEIQTGVRSWRAWHNVDDEEGIADLKINGRVITKKWKPHGGGHMGFIFAGTPFRRVGWFEHSEGYRYIYPEGTMQGPRPEGELRLGKGE